MTINKDTGDSRRPGFGYRWNEWQTIWHGIPVTGDVTLGSSTREPGYRLGDESSISRSTQSITSKQSTLYVDNKSTTGSILYITNNKFVDGSIVPYLNPNETIVRGEHLKPSTVLYPFIDGRPAQVYWMQADKLVLANTSNVANMVSFNAKDFETVNSSSGGTATLVLAPSVISQKGNLVSNMLHVVDMRGFFNVGDILCGTTSNVRVTLSSVLKLTDNVRVLNSDASKLNLATSAANTSNSVYYNTLINIVKGTGNGQIRLITGYDNVTRIANVSPNWATKPDNTSVYSIGSAMTTGAGTVAGKIVFPTVGLRLASGNKQIKLTDNPRNSNIATTHGEGVYNGVGVINTVQDIPPAPRGPRIVSEKDVDNMQVNPIVAPLTATPTRINTPTIAATDIPISDSGSYLGTVVLVPRPTANATANVGNDLGGGHALTNLAIVDPFSAWVFP